MSYQEIKVSVSENQKEKIKSAIRSESPVSIRLSFEDLQNGSDILEVTQRQLGQISKAIKSQKGITLKMSKTQVKHNMKVEGGFLSALLGTAARVLPAVLPSVMKSLGIGALTGLASTGVEKMLGGSHSQPPMLGAGLYLKKGGSICHIESDGSGLYLSPFVQGRGFNPRMLDGISDGIVYQPENEFLPINLRETYGEGILFGANSPFKNVPLLNLIL